MILSGLSGNEMYCQAQKGWTPGNIVVGNSVYSLGVIRGLTSGLQTLSGGEIAALLRAAGLHQQWSALRRARQLQRARNGELRAGMVDAMDQPGIGEPAGGPVGHQRAIFPTVPERQHDIDELRRTAIAILMRGKRAQAEIACRALVIGRHHVPADAPAAGVVQRGEGAGNVVRVVEGRG